MFYGLSLEECQKICRRWVGGRGCTDGIMGRSVSRREWGRDGDERKHRFVLARSFLQGDMRLQAKLSRDSCVRLFDILPYEYAYTYSVGTLERKTKGLRFEGLFFSFLHDKIQRFRRTTRNYQAIHCAVPLVFFCFVGGVCERVLCSCAKRVRGGGGRYRVFVETWHLPSRKRSSSSRFWSRPFCMDNRRCSTVHQ